METTTTNKMIAMFNMEVIKKAIANCPKDEIVIIIGHWSIVKPEYTQEELENMHESDDWDDMERELDTCLMVNDYDDLICDPHGIMND